MGVEERDGEVKADHVDDLTWEQKEMVLRRVFVYMNLQNSKKVTISVCQLRLSQFE